MSLRSGSWKKGRLCCVSGAFGGAFLHRVHKSSSWKKGALVLLHWWGKDLKQDVPVSCHLSAHDITHASCIATNINIERTTHI